MSAVIDNDSNLKRAALITTTVASFLTPFMSSSVSIALPAIAAEYKIDAILLSWIPTAAILATAICVIPLGRIADIYGRKKVFMLGSIVFTVASLGGAFSNSIWMILAFRILQGIGTGSTFGVAIAILTSVYPAKERGRALGINTASTYLGLSLGPYLGGLLTEYLGWRSLFLANVPLGLIVLLLIWLKLKGEWMGARGEKYDIFGTVIFAVTIAALMYGLSLLPEVNGLIIIAFGLAGAVSFVIWENHIPHPILNMKLFRENITFAFSMLATIINYASTFAVSFLLSLYLQYIMGFKADHAGLIILTMPAIQSALSPLAGRLSDRIEPRILASLGMSLNTLGLGIFIFLGNKIPLVMIVAALLIIGSGIAFFSPPNANSIMSSVEQKYYGVASATLATMRQIGFMLSMGITMLMFALYIGRAEITPELYGAFLESLRPIFIIFTVLSFGGVFASLARGNTRRTP